jgi:hypothetical protein
MKTDSSIGVIFAYYAQNLLITRSCCSKLHKTATIHFDDNALMKGERYEQLYEEGNDP